MRWGVVFGGLFLGLVAAAQLPAVADQTAPVVDPAGLDALARLNQQILKNPSDIALNLQYAALAEKLGLERLALAAYERILMTDSHNQAAQAGIDRVRHAIEPNTTQYVLAVGYAYETDPRYTQVDTTRGRNELDGTLSISDERTIDDLRWRTLGDASILDHPGDGGSILDYGHVGAVSGPLLDSIPGVTFNPALGVGTAYFDHRWFYAEVSANAIFEIYPNGAEQALALRAAWRDYNHAFFPATQGGYADAIGKITLPEIFPDTAIGFSPWVRVSEIAGGIGTAIVPLTTDVQPGDYTELGVRAAAYRSVTDWLTLGANLGTYGRLYQSQEVSPLTVRRKDVALSPGATAVIPHLFSYQTDLRLGYQYTWDHSNINTFTYKDHLISVTLVTRF
jgi:hypothetical protein